MKSLNSRSALRRAPLAKPAPPLRGFTLVELLVVITIIGILIALLLPAVQAAREAARRMQCTNNLKQWALGALNHESAQGSLPTSGVSGWHVGDPDLGFGLKQVGGWMYNTLPYIEQQTFHDQGMGQPSFQKKAIWTKAVAVPLAALFCPSRRAPTAGGLGLYATGTVYWQNISRPTAIVHNDYAANTGGCTWQDFLDWSQNIPGSKPGNGVVVRNTLVKMADIKDGTSNTYLFGEKYLTPDAYADGMDGGDDNCAYCGFDPDIQRWSGHVDPLNPTSAASLAHVPFQDTPGGVYSFVFGSAHPGGFNMALCDGSVQSISYSIDPCVHEYLGNREDGHVIDGSKL